MSLVFRRTFTKNIISQKFHIDTPAFSSQIIDAGIRCQYQMFLGFPICFIGKFGPTGFCQGTNRCSRVKQTPHTAELLNILFSYILTFISIII